MNFLQQLDERNRLLYRFGWFNYCVGLFCLGGIFIDDFQLLGVSRWLKPMKFYVSVGILVWTLGWLMSYLPRSKKLRRYSLAIFYLLLLENGLILMQSIRKTTSHFNIHTAFDTAVFNLMGILILLFTIVCIRICIDFFRLRPGTMPEAALWGIRVGFIFFIMFSLEGGVMVGMLRHTVGAGDGSPGMPLLNWSRQHGDLRIAHFLGIHSLQILPLIGFHFASTKRQIIAIGTIYFLAVMFVLLQALRGIPLL
jgi:hypothetical protein